MTDMPQQGDFDLDRMMDGLRAEIAQRRKSEPRPAPPDTAGEPAVPPDWSRVYRDLNEADELAEIGHGLPDLHHVNVLKRTAGRFVTSAILKLSVILRTRQSNYNRAIARAVRWIADDVRALQVSTEDLHRRLDDLHRRLDGQQTVADDHDSRLDRLQAAADRTAAAADAAASALGSRLTALDRHGSALETAVRRMRAQVTLQDDRVSQLLEEARRRLPGPFDAEQLASIASKGPDRFDRLHAALMDGLRGAEEDITRRLSWYVPVVRDAVRRDAPLLDIGSGRGEWLELLQQEGLHAFGVDTNPILVTDCRTRGLDVRRGDAVGALTEMTDGSLGAVTAFHVVEHLPFETLLTFLDECLRVLASGGVLVLETPNPDNLLVGARNFWLDPTHERPLPNTLLRAIVEDRGFTVEQVLDLHPVSEALRPADVEIPPVLERYLFGPQDYAVVARRP